MGRRGKADCKPVVRFMACNALPGRFPQAGLFMTGTGTLPAMKIHGLNHVAIHVADVERSCKFYRAVLRVEQMPRPAFDFPGARYRLGAGQELHLIGRRDEPIVAGSRSNHFALRVDDIEVWEEHLKNVSVEFRPKKQRPDGAWQIFFATPGRAFRRIVHAAEIATFSNNQNPIFAISRSRAI